MWIKSKDDLRRYSLEELEEMCTKGIRLFVRLKKLYSIMEKMESLKGESCNCQTPLCLGLIEEIFIFCRGRLVAAGR